MSASLRTNEEQRPGTILVVDDQEPNRELVSLHLTGEGYEVRLAHSGEAALASFAREPSDLVLLDVMMPGLDGFQTCERLRALPSGAHTAVLFLTSLADVETHAHALASGGDDFLTKPIARTELLLRVRSLLRIKRMHEQVQRSHDVIRQQRDALIEAQRLRQETTALVVHDMKSPLAAIMMNADYLSSRKELSAELAGCCADIVSSARKLNRMVMNLLDLSQSENGALALRLAPVRLADLRRELEQEFGRRAAERAQVLCFGPLLEEPIEADRELLSRLLSNLVENAIKYSPPSGRIEVSAVRNAIGEIELRVRDEGSGVPESHREKIFERYVRLDEDEGTARTSRGLGLASCRVAAEALGGEIWVQDAEPHGTMFCVRLPASRK